MSSYKSKEQILNQNIDATKLLLHEDKERTGLTSNLKYLHNQFKVFGNCAAEVDSNRRSYRLCKSQFSL